MTEMAQTAQKTAAPRPGRRTGSRAATAKPATTKAAPAETVAEDAPVPATEGAKVGPIVLEPHAAGDTKQFSRWVPPQGTGCVGTFYAPLGATEVRVMIYGPAEALDA